MATDPTMTADPSSGAGEDFTITIKYLAEDGTFTVALGEDSADQGADESGQDQSAEQPATADNIDDACQIAKEMWQAESGEESGESDTADGNAAMDEPGAKAYWDQLAAKKSKGPM